MQWRDLLWVSVWFSRDGLPVFMESTSFGFLWVSYALIKVAIFMLLYKVDTRAKPGALKKLKKNTKKHA